MLEMLNKEGLRSLEQNNFKISWFVRFQYIFVAHHMFIRSIIYKPIYIDFNLISLG